MLFAEKDVTFCHFCIFSFQELPALPLFGGTVWPHGLTSSGTQHWLVQPFSLHLIGSGMGM